MTTVWERHGVYEHVVRILEDAPLGTAPGHHMGRPFLTAYQIAIKLDECVPELLEDLRVEIGGRGSGVHFTLSSYVGLRLSQLIKDDPGGRLEGGFLSNQSVAVLEFADSRGRPVVSSLESDQTPALFRLRS